VLESETSVSAIARQFGVSTQTVTSLPDDLPRHHLHLRHHNAQWDRVVFSDKCGIKLSKTGVCQRQGERHANCMQEHVYHGSGRIMV